MADKLKLPDYIGAVRGYRVYRPEASKLTSLNGTVWDSNRMEAECKYAQQPHPVPELECSCGLYAFTSPNQRDLALEAAQGYGVVAQVKAWGRVVMAEHGLRAQHMQIEALICVDPALKYAYDAVGQRYDVPVVLAEQETPKLFKQVKRAAWERDLISRWSSENNRLRRVHYELNSSLGPLKTVRFQQQGKPWHKAKADRKCYKCLTIIRAGERYMSYSLEGSRRLCVMCGETHMNQTTRRALNWLAQHPGADIAGALAELDSLEAQMRSIQQSIQQSLQEAMEKPGLGIALLNPFNRR